MKFLKSDKESNEGMSAMYCREPVSNTQLSMC